MVSWRIESWRGGKLICKIESIKNEEVVMVEIKNKRSKKRNLRFPKIELFFCIFTESIK